MGFFSWMTQDTNKSIANIYSNREPFNVSMIDDKGNEWKEDYYEGYGTFGGKDYYELLAEMNGLTSDLEGEAYTNDIRLKAIDLVFKDNPSGENQIGVKYPNLVESTIGWRYTESGPESCPDQGYFYNDYEECEEDGYINFFE